MEAYVRGKSGEARAQAIAKCQTIAEVVLAGLLGPLDHMHACGLVHRDIKLENIVLRASGRVHLLDLGICGKAGQEPRLEGGTKVWMPPRVLLQPRGAVHASQDW
jgi:serine/threonine protein kinase